MSVFMQLLTMPIAALDSLSLALTPRLAAIAGQAPTEGYFVIASIIVSTAVVGLACSLWSSWEHVRFLQLRKVFRAATASARAAILLRDAILDAGREAV